MSDHTSSNKTPTLITVTGGSAAAFDKGNRYRDGGVLGDVTAQVQHGRVIVSGNHTELGNPENKQTDKAALARVPMKESGGSVGAVFGDAPANGFGVQAYAGGAVQQTTTTVDPKIAAILKAMKLPAVDEKRTDASLQGKAALSYGRDLGYVEARVSAEAAADLGNHGHGAAAGLSATVGHGLRGLSVLPLLNTNAEGADLRYVAHPEDTRAGDWGVGVRVSEGRQSNNPYVPSDGPVNAREVTSLVVGAVVAPLKNVTLGVLGQHSDSPADGLKLPPKLQGDKGPSTETIVKVTGTVRF